MGRKGSGTVATTVKECHTASVMNAYVSVVDVTSAGMAGDARLTGRAQGVKRVRKVTPASLKQARLENVLSTYSALNHYLWDLFNKCPIIN